MAATWFEQLFGFEERSYDETKHNFEVVGTTLRSRVNHRSYAIGELETPSLQALRQRAQKMVGQHADKLQVANVAGDVRQMHREPANRHALFQVASQFNLLEMVGPNVSPEAGVTRYKDDHTQGPACAIAAGAATVYRNYFAPVEGQTGQTSGRQIDCLQDLGAALGNQTGDLWEMRNGYALCSEAGLEAIERKLAAMNDQELDALRGLLRVGLHWGVEATEAGDRGQIVSQAFCSALPVSYTRVPAPCWQSFATLVLEAAYEATLWAAVENAHRFGSRIVYLTQLGGGAFGNETAWIHAAMRRALQKVVGVDLDVRLVSYGGPDTGLQRLAEEFA